MGKEMDIYGIVLNKKCLLVDIYGILENTFDYQTKKIKIRIFNDKSLKMSIEKK